MEHRQETTPPPAAADPPDRTPDPAPADDERAAAYRGRLLDGLQAAIEERGLANTTVADIVRLARTSRRTFYEHFADRAECFQALVQRHSDLAWRTVLAAVDTTAPPRTQLRTCIAAMCADLATRPALTVTAIRDLPSLSPEACAQQRSLLDSTADLLVALADRARPDEDGRSAAQRRTLGRLAFGGMREVVAVTLEDGEDLRARADEITEAVLRVLDLPA